MLDPLVALAVFTLVVLLLGLVFWPGTGVLARAARRASQNERVRVEDAIKHCLTVEATGRRATLESLAGALEIPRGEAARLAERLAELDLALAEDGALALTDAGRQWALRIVRSHRLWERYLADRTGVEPGEWHAEAERLEHQLSEADAERLSAMMGHPLVDPHGDPIPTASGDLPAVSGIALPSLLPGTSARVTHVEDEPAETYHRLVRAGLTPSAVLTRLPAPGNRVRIRLEGVEHEFDALAAGGVTVEPLAEGEDADTHIAHATLASLAPGASARVLRLAPACQGPQRRRLLDLGVVPGTVITAEFASAAGDPVAYRIRGALIALRRRHAEWIVIEPMDGEVAA
ncbi:MAG TPA: metal-dependent transcriptional regulator [Gemmatimonadales bacterium]|nr:metal-dependent transcriptional regulator [Gemmatimonadales bacterium]